VLGLVPCEKLRRQQSTPVRARRSTISSDGGRAERGDDLGAAQQAHQRCAGERARGRVDAAGAELLLDRAAAVVLGDAVRARRRAGLDLAGVGGDREVGDRGVLGLARAVRDDRDVAVLGAERDRVERLGQRPIWFTLTRIAFATPRRCPLRGARVRDEEVVADELHAVAERVGERFQPSQSSSAQAVLDRHDRIAVDEVAQKSGIRPSRARGPRRSV
jgi:hypothetical protein